MGWYLLANVSDVDEMKNVKLVPSTTEQRAMGALFGSPKATKKSRSHQNPSSPAKSR